MLINTRLVRKTEKTLVNSPHQHRDMRSLLHNQFADSSSPSTLYRLMKRADDPFPAPFKIGGKNFWRDDIVDAWFERQGADQTPAAA